MARTTISIAYHCSFDEAQRKIEAVLRGKNFKLVNLKSGETVWKNGTGMMTAMKFVKVEYAQDQVKLSAWVQAGIGDVGGSEMDLTGFVGALPKKQLMKVLEEIEAQF